MNKKTSVKDPGNSADDGRRCWESAVTAGLLKLHVDEIFFLEEDG